MGVLNGARRCITDRSLASDDTLRLVIGAQAESWGWGAMSPSPAPPISLFWFRKGLRLHDNPSLWAAIKDTHACYPVFVLDPWFLKPERVGVNRINFLLQSLSGIIRVGI